MNKILAISAIALVGAAFTSCDDFLDDNRYPLTSIVDKPDYWNSATNVQLQLDRNYDIYPGYGSGNSYGWFFFKTLSDDQVGSSFANWAYPTIPSTSDDWDYSTVRGANYVINKVPGSTLSNADKANFWGIARLIRATEYYRLVRMYGDVVWENYVVDPSDPILYEGRTDRDIVMDSVYEDLKFAQQTISTESAKLAWSRDLATATLSEVALYEGTFCKYRNQADNGKAADPARAKKYLEISAAASEALLGKYGFCNDYHSIYNSLWAEQDSPVDPTQKITGLSDNPELIFGRRYDSVNGRHSTISYTASSTTTSGMSLDAFKAFLFLDGKPMSQHPESTLEGVATTIPNGEEDLPALSIANELAVRDARLSAITDPYVYYKGMEWNRAGCTGLNSSSGFGVYKFDNVLLPVNDRTLSSNNYTSGPIYWTSYIACNYAEAKTELDAFDQAAFDKSLKHLYQRAGLTTITGPAAMAAINDPANNMGVSSLLWEVRRCRRCELMFDNWIRYWDLIRWHQLELLDNTKHPEVLMGACVKNAPVQPTTVQVTNNFINAGTGVSQRKYNAKYYLYPIPSKQYDLNHELGQNPGW